MHQYVLCHKAALKAVHFGGYAAEHSTAQPGCQVLLRHPHGRHGDDLSREEGVHQTLHPHSAGGHRGSGGVYYSQHTGAGILFLCLPSLAVVTARFYPTVPAALNRHVSAAIPFVLLVT